MIASFNEVIQKNLKNIGGKATSLCKLLENEINVPNGFVITDSEYDLSLLFEYYQSLKTDFVAVRSSANLEDGKSDSFAGQFETYLYISRDNLGERIKDCFAALNSEKIVNYCKSKSINIDNLSLSVIVQAMVPAEKSGVCFTKHPVANDKNQIIIESVFGLGELLVSGQVTPDTYILNKQSLVIIQEINNVQKQALVFGTCGGTELRDLDSKKSTSMKLNKQELDKITKACLEIEALYSQQMDIEWAMVGEELYILQARPITT